MYIYIYIYMYIYIYIIFTYMFNNCDKFNPEEKKQLEISYSKFCNVFNQIISLEINAAQKILHTDQ